MLIPVLQDDLSPFSDNLRTRCTESSHQTETSTNLNTGAAGDIDAGQRVHIIAQTVPLPTRALSPSLRNHARVAGADLEEEGAAERGGATEAGTTEVTTSFYQDLNLIHMTSAFAFTTNIKNRFCGNKRLCSHLNI